MIAITDVNGSSFRSRGADLALQPIRRGKRRLVAAETRHDLHAERQSRLAAQAGDVHARAAGQRPQLVEDRIAGGGVAGLRSKAGLPLGVQIVARFGRDQTALSAADWLEREIRAA